MADPADQNLTRAERGVAIYETLTILLAEAIKGKNVAAALQLRRAFNEAALHLVEATGARFTVPEVLNTLTTDDRAVLLAQSVRRAHQFLTTQLRTNKYDCVLGRPRARIRNEVDREVYDHLATVTVDDGRVYYLATNERGQHVMSEKLYWSVDSVLLADEAPQ